MTRFGVTFNAVSIPANSGGISFIIYEDVGADGSGANTDPNGKNYDNSDTLSLSDGTTSYTTANTFDGADGNEIWWQFQAGPPSDISTVADITTDISITVQTLTISAPATTVNVSTPSAQAGAVISGTVSGVSNPQDAVIRFIEQGSDTHIAKTSPDSTGDYSQLLDTGQTVHVVFEYDSGGTKENAASKHTIVI